MSLFVMLSIVIALSGGLLIGLTLLFRMPVTDNHRIREEPVKTLKGPTFWRTAIFNSVLSISMVYGSVYLLYGGGY